MWRNWQTRWVQVSVLARAWRFKSSHPHHKVLHGPPERVAFLVFMMRLLRWLALPLAAPLLYAQFAAGVARREITPKEPTPMWGYGDRHDALSTGTIDPLFAEALVLRAGDRKLAIVGL